MVTSGENQNKAEPQYMNTPTVWPRPTELNRPLHQENHFAIPADTTSFLHTEQGT